jgi:hypothetical protein
MDNKNVSKKQKLLERLEKSPPVTDFTWKELVTVMGHFDFKEIKKGSSHIGFYHLDSNHIVKISRNHPAPFTLLRYQIEEAIKGINFVKGFRGGNENTN